MDAGAKLSERDVCTKFIAPALVAAGWDVQAQIREEVGFTKGRIIVRGRLVTRGKAKRADYVLYYKHLPLALIEAKDQTHAAGDGMQQALAYAATLDIPYVFSSNGKGFQFHDRSGVSVPLEQSLSMNEFPSPNELWNRYRSWKSLQPAQESTVLQAYYEDGSGKEPRYYQRNAINAAVEAIAKGQNRILLVMATGTGKTYTAFQIIWRLWKAGQKKRILFLADRNVLIDQTMVNDFRPFGPAMAKLSTASKTIERADGTEIELTLALDKKRRIDPAYEIYLGLYQAITGPEERQKLFREFSPDFFDLIVIDECHRGSAAEDSAWREILEYFGNATHIGLTATPKETEYVSNIHYFGEPVYTYSLKQGISDGFLAPYKVIKVHLDVDVQGYRPQRGETDKHGYAIDDRLYNEKDFDRTLVIDERTQRVAKWISDYLKQSGDRFQKTIVFCVDTEHAARMRQALVNENADLVKQNPRYVMRITGDDAEGTAQLGNFIDPESTWPVIVIYELEKQAEAAGWYTHSVETLASGNEKVSYKPGNALDAIAAEGITMLGTSRAEMDRLIDLMGGLKTEQVEIIATLFAAWNDALLDGRTPDDDWIVEEVREHWHVRKQRFTPSQLMTWLGWMRQNDVIPLGHPPHTMQQTTMEF